MKSLILMLVVATGLSGCTFLSKLSTPTAQPYIQAAVTVAVAATIGTNPATQHARAAQIKAIAQEVLLVATGSEVPLTQLQTIVMQKIASLNLPPGDVAAAQILLAALDAAIQLEIANLSNGAVTPSTQAAVTAILNDVITATAAYGV